MVGVGIGYGCRGPLERLLTRLKGIGKGRKEKVSIPSELRDDVPPEADEETVKKVVKLFDYEKEQNDFKQIYKDISDSAGYTGDAIADEGMSLPEFDPGEEDDGDDILVEDYRREETLLNNGPEDDTPEPYEIGPEEYGREDGYEMTDAHFYDGDEVFTDERDEEMEDWQNIVGHDAADNFAMNPDVNNFYVRNERLKQDIEIVRVKGRFMDTP